MVQQHKSLPCFSLFSPRIKDNPCPNKNKPRMKRILVRCREIQIACCCCSFACFEMKTKQAKSLKRDFGEVKRSTQLQPQVTDHSFTLTPNNRFTIFMINCFLLLPDSHKEHVPVILVHALSLDADLARVDLHRPGEAGVEPLPVPVHGQTAV